MIAASVILCTFDRPRLLERALASLERERVPGGAGWELLLIDNGGQPGTREVASRFSERLPLRLIHEPEPGKSRALNRGIAAARGPLLLFADDDVEVRPGWVAAFVDTARRVPEAGWFGGRSLPAWEEGAPRWVLGEIPPALRGYCCHYDLGGKGRLYSHSDPLPIGACMAVRASTFEDIGGYDISLGPRGGFRGVGDDTELVMRAMAGGIPGYWVPEAQVEHFVPLNRLRSSSAFRYGLMKGRQQTLLTGRRVRLHQALGRASSQVLKGIAQWVRGRGAWALLCVLNAGIALGAFQAEEPRVHGAGR